MKDIISFPVCKFIEPIAKLAFCGNSESRIQNPESRIQNPESRIQNPESRIQNPESRIQNEILTQIQLVFQLF